MTTKRTSADRYDLFYSMRCPKGLKAQWVRVEDEARDNAAQTDVGGKLIGFQPHDPMYQEMFVGSIECVTAILSEGYTKAFRNWLEDKCGIVG
jgi:hypothetical protein